MWRGPITNPQITSCIAAAGVFDRDAHEYRRLVARDRSVRVSTASGDTKMLQANAKSSPRLRPRTAKQRLGRSLGGSLAASQSKDASAGSWTGDVVAMAFNRVRRNLRTRARRAEIAATTPQ